MAEKQLRHDISETIQELMEIKGELSRRLRSMKRRLKPAAAVLVVYVGMKVGLKITRMMLGTVLRHKLLLLVMTAVVLLRLRNTLPRGAA